MCLKRSVDVDVFGLHYMLDVSTVVTFKFCFISKCFLVDLVPGVFVYRGYNEVWIVWMLEYLYKNILGTTCKHFVCMFHVLSGGIMIFFKYYNNLWDTMSASNDKNLKIRGIIYYMSVRLLGWLFIDTPPEHICDYFREGKNKIAMSYYSGVRDFKGVVSINVFA